MSTWGDWARGAADSGVPVTVERDPAREAARKELLHAEYHRHDPSLPQRIYNWITDQLGHLFDQLGGGSGGMTGLIVFLVLFALIGAALWWRLGPPGRAATTAAAALFAADGPRSASDHRAAAQQHAAAAEWAAAVREQMRALIRSLEERTLLNPRPGRTADEAAREAGRHLPDHATALADAARLFDDVAFGDRTADQAAYQRLVDLDERLRKARPLIQAGAA
jgi:hypothetical protein